MAIHAFIKGNNFDTRFDFAGAGRPAQLTVILRVRLVPLDPTSGWAKVTHDAQLPGAAPRPLPARGLAAVADDRKYGKVADADGNMVDCQTWLISEWSTFRRRFKHTVEFAWGNQMLFFPSEGNLADSQLSDADFKRLIGNLKMPAHVQGALEIDLVETVDAAHAVIEVVNLRRAGTRFREQMTRISNETVQFKHKEFKFGKSRNVNGKTGQITAAHEVGHWLRGPTQRVFEHIDRQAMLKRKKELPRMPKKDLDRMQYGNKLSRYYSLMGGGSVVGDHEAGPWMERLAKHTHLQGGWVFVHKLHFHWSVGDISERQKRLLGS